MKKILTALAVLAVIAAGTATALFQQLKPEEYDSIDAVVAENKTDTVSVYQTIDIGDDTIVILYHEANDAYSTMYIKKSGEGYVLKEKNGPIRNELGFTQSFQYSKKGVLKASSFREEPVLNGSFPLKLQKKFP